MLLFYLYYNDFFIWLLIYPWLKIALPVVEYWVSHVLSGSFCFLFLSCSSSSLPGASVRNSAHGKGHEEGGLAYAKAWSSLRKPPVPEHLTPKPESVLCSHLHLWLYGGLSPITVSLGQGVNVQLQGNKNSWSWQECFSLRTALRVI